MADWGDNSGDAVVATTPIVATAPAAAIDDGLASGELPEVKLFGKWSLEEVQVSDISLVVSRFSDLPLNMGGLNEQVWFLCILGLHRSQGEARKICAAQRRPLSGETFSQSDMSDRRATRLIADDARPKQRQKADDGSHHQARIRDYPSARGRSRGTGRVYQYFNPFCRTPCKCSSTRWSTADRAKTRRVSAERVPSVDKQSMCHHCDALIKPSGCCALAHARLRSETSKRLPNVWLMSWSMRRKDRATRTRSRRRTNSNVLRNRIVNIPSAVCLVGLWHTNDHVVDFIDDLVELKSVVDNSFLAWYLWCDATRTDLSWGGYPLNYSTKQCF